MAYEFEVENNYLANMQTIFYIIKNLGGYYINFDNIFMIPPILLGVI